MAKKTTEKRKKALARLESQLQKGVKNKGKDTLPLTDSDKARIDREIGILKSKI